MFELYLKSQFIKTDNLSHMALIFLLITCFCPE